MIRFFGPPVAALGLVFLSACGVSEDKVCNTYQLGTSEAKYEFRGLLSQAFPRSSEDLTESDDTQYGTYAGDYSPTWSGEFCLDQTNSLQSDYSEPDLCARVDYPLYPQLLAPTCDCPSDSELSEMSRADAYSSRFTELCEGLVALHDLDVDCTDTAAVIGSTYPGDYAGDSGLLPDYGNNQYGGSWGQVFVNAFYAETVVSAAPECMDDLDEEPLPSVFDSSTLSPARMLNAIQVDISGRLDVDAYNTRIGGYEGATACMVDADGGAECWRITPEFTTISYSDILTKHNTFDMTLQGLSDGPWTGVQVKQLQTTESECEHESIVCLESAGGPMCWYGTFDGCEGSRDITLDPVDGFESLVSVLPVASGTLTGSSDGARAAICGLTAEGYVGCWGAEDDVFKTSWDPGYTVVSEDQALNIICAAHQDGYIHCWDVAELLEGMRFPEILGSTEAGTSVDAIEMEGQVTDITHMAIRSGYDGAAMSVLCALKTTGEVECARYHFMPVFAESQLHRNFDDARLRIATPKGLPSLSSIALVTIGEGDEDGYAGGGHGLPLLCGIHSDGGQLSCWGPFNSLTTEETGWEADLERKLFTTSGSYSDVFRDDIQGTSSWFVNSHNLPHFLTL
jgi:hypothetical protein